MMFIIQQKTLQMLVKSQLQLLVNATMLVQ